VSPFFHVGVSAGTSVVERGAWMAGVHLGFASKAYVLQFERAPALCGRVGAL